MGWPFFMRTIFFLLFTCRLLAQTSGFATAVDGTPIHYRIFGTGKPLLVINGGPGMNSNGFETLAKKLCNDRQVILYDQRGTGLSKLPELSPKTVSMQLMVDDIESLRQSLKIERWDVLGHSFGGMLASYYATVHPKAIDHLILSSSGGIDLGLLDYVNKSINDKLSNTERDSLAYWNKRIADGDTTHTARLGRGRNLAPAYLQNRKFIPVLAQRLTQGNAQLNQLIWDDLQRISFDCAPKLRQFNRPTLIIQGKQDIISAETAERAHRAIPHSTVLLLDHCGHYGWLDTDTEYLSAIDRFLKS